MNLEASLQKKTTPQAASGTVEESKKESSDAQATVGKRKEAPESAK